MRWLHGGRRLGTSPAAALTALWYATCLVERAEFVRTNVGEAATCSGLENREGVLWSFGDEQASEVEVVLA
jgi:hypothetical protein